jgi:3-phenylpropionate/trans-cinnamate dioxygenase ferredoxin reductase component
MSHYNYAIIGGGMAADAAVGGIREVDASRSIGVFSMESDPPYNRPPLSKDLWKGTPMASIWRDTANRDAELHLACKIESIDPERKCIVDNRGTSHTYDKLLLATGGTPRQLPFGADRIIYFRTLADYRRLQALAEKGQRFAVIGGGFIGSEIAAALASNGKEVTMITPEQIIGRRVFPRDLGIFLNGYFRQKGVELLTEERVVNVEARGDFLAVKTRGLKSAREREIKVDGVVAGIGLQPNIDLAKAATLQVDNGIVVDEYLRTSHPDIYAAGDVATFYNPSLGNRIRVEHEDNANTMGRLAGRNMAGKREPYHHLPSFYSDLFEFSYEAVGELDPRLEIVTDWTKRNRLGTIYYLREHRVRGVLLWNIWGAVNAARALIAEPGPLKIEDLKKRIPLG